MTPQQKRVLAASRAYNGTCSADWVDGLGVDGKGKITRVPARIEELEEKHGCVFEIVGWRNKTRVFRLIEDSEARRASVESDTHKMCGSSEISPGVPLAPDDVEVAGRISNDPGSPHAGLVVPPAAGDLSTGRLFEVGEPVSTHYEDEAA